MSCKSWKRQSRGIKVVFPFACYLRYQKTSFKLRNVLGQESKSYRTRNCDTSNLIKTPPGTPIRPQGGLIYSGDTNQCNRSNEVLNKIFEQQYDVPVKGLHPVNMFGLILKIKLR